MQSGRPRSHIPPRPLATTSPSRRGRFLVGASPAPRNDEGRSLDEATMASRLQDEDIPWQFPSRWGRHWQRPPREGTMVHAEDPRYEGPTFRGAWPFCWQANQGRAPFLLAPFPKSASYLYMWDDPRQRGWRIPNRKCAINRKSASPVDCEVNLIRIGISG